MITKIKIDNFKSLVNFELKLSEFNCIVGLNGCGKSTVLQAIDFLANLMAGDVSGWLEQRQWDKSDINSKLIKKSNIDFEVDLFLAQEQHVVWTGSFNRSSLHCTQESITVDGTPILKVLDGKLMMSGMPSGSIFMVYEGSLLSTMKLKKNAHQLSEIKNAILAISSLDLISPSLLRKSNISSGGKLGLGGEKLSAFLHELGQESKTKLTSKLQNIYQQLNAIETKSLTSGWKELSVIESFEGIKIKTKAQHINDGMLRLMAIFSQLSSREKFFLFDEIENGINPELVELLIDTLVKTDNQILVTTHSPLILNFIEDDVARDGIIYLYKNKKGITKAIKLFDIPSLNEKLSVMGPGEAFIDTDLTQLYKEIQRLEILGA
ncbi:MAG: AAA family ATPase [Methylococcales bacterium]